MKLELDLQRASRARIPSATRFRRWVMAALRGRRARAEITIRVVTPAESRRLNARYRGKDKPTNVLSFACEAPSLLKLPALGDLVICAQVVKREARQQGKPVEAHWAHMTVHGVLHLLGYDHQRKNEARHMEALEKTILAGLGHPDPYEIVQGKNA